MQQLPAAACHVTSVHCQHHMGAAAAAAAADAACWLVLKNAVEEQNRLAMLTRR